MVGRDGRGLDLSEKPLYQHKNRQYIITSPLFFPVSELFDLVRGIWAGWFSQEAECVGS